MKKEKKAQVIDSLRRIGQDKIVLRGAEEGLELDVMLEQLAEVEAFYASIGGIVGYHETVLKLRDACGEKSSASISEPPMVDLSGDNTAWVDAGLAALPEMGEIYPLGGLGTRLNMSKPVAHLPFCGRSLLEGLIRDVVSRERLYFERFGKRLITPIAMMTSFEKGNHHNILNLLSENQWFGRPKESFFVFPQISVPVITEEGNWSLLAPMQLNLHPGGHGALWRMAEERGVSDWFAKQGRHRLLVRQINNPIAGIDDGLLAFVGVGAAQNKTFGFAACDRDPKGAEGALVLRKEGERQQIVNIEYTEFVREKIAADAPYPANTNILYADLRKLLPLVRACPLPGLMVNMKNEVPFIDENGGERSLKGGRLESMMQNIANALKDTDTLSTYVTCNVRDKTLVATKRSFVEGASLLETPEGAFQTLLRNAHTLLSEVCRVHVEDKLPLFLYHPALGPLYTHIAEKIQGGTFCQEAELQIEAADVQLKNLYLDGSLRIEASTLEGKCTLIDVRVENEGVDRFAGNVYWKNEIARKESFHIVIEGDGEFFAEGVTFKGGETIVVPAGTRVVRAGHTSRMLS